MPFGLKKKFGLMLLRANAELVRGRPRVVQGPSPLLGTSPLAPALTPQRCGSRMPERLGKVGTWDLVGRAAATSEPLRCPAEGEGTDHGPGVVLSPGKCNGVLVCIGMGWPSNLGLGT